MRGLEASMFVVGEAVIDDAVREASFCCDVAACKGACCTLPGGRGAPLEDDEVLEITKAFPSARKFLSDRNLRAIERDGLIDGRPGDFATTCVEERECVFVFFDEGVAQCSFERAFEQGLTDWRKPVSCHLFPIRVREFGAHHLRYEEIDECGPGRARGDLRAVKLYDFLREPLVRRFGEEWYARFLRQCRNHTEM